MNNENLQEFIDYFSSCKKEAFRFEYIQEFNVSEEKEAFKKWNNGQKHPDIDFNSQWHKILNSAKERGVVFKRVRYVEKPFCKYIQFEIDWGYLNNKKYGEQITFIEKDNMEISDKPQDFWIFDNETVFLMNYSTKGDFLGVEKTENIEYFLQFKNYLLTTSKESVE